jgi:hypothetical protein
MRSIGLVLVGLWYGTLQGWLFGLPAWALAKFAFDWPDTASVAFGAVAWVVYYALAIRTAFTARPAGGPSNYTPAGGWQEERARRLERQHRIDHPWD